MLFTCIFVDMKHHRTIIWMFALVLALGAVSCKTKQKCAAYDNVELSQTAH